MSMLSRILIFCAVALSAMGSKAAFSRVNEASADVSDIGGAEKSSVTSPVEPAKSSPPQAQRISRGAAEQVSGQDQNDLDSPVEMLFKTGLALTFVLGLILLVARLTRQPSGFRRRQGQASVEILDGQMLPGRQMVQLVRVGRRVLVLACSSDGMRTLSEISDPEEVEELIKSGRESDSQDSPRISLTNLLPSLFFPARSECETDDLVSVNDPHLGPVVDQRHGGA